MPMDPLVGTSMRELTSGLGQREDGVFRSGVLMQVTSSLASLVFSGVLWCSLVFSGGLLQVPTRLCSTRLCSDSHGYIPRHMFCMHTHLPPYTHNR